MNLTEAGHLTLGVCFLKVSKQIDTSLQRMIVDYREDIDLQNVIDWVQADWVGHVEPVT